VTPFLPHVLLGDTVATPRRPLYSVTYYLNAAPNEIDNREKDSKITKKESLKKWERERDVIVMKKEVSDHEKVSLKTKRRELADRTHFQLYGKLLKLNLFFFSF